MLIAWFLPPPLFAVFLILAIAIVIGCSVFICNEKTKSKEKRKEEIYLLAKQAKGASNLTEIYLKIIVKHGTSSDEARWFRFGAQQHCSNETMQAFNHEADLVDLVCEEIKKKKKNKTLK